ncbi:MAG: FAD-dependent oxidoreductase [Alphaproteobacteria bacterium]|nr:FAD-dependent oxidoreductase [Alphaproteobacteria bacterium]
MPRFETDIAIVGSGGAGIAAGIEALDAGAKVIAFEKDAEPGGAAAISGGGCMMVGTPLQKENGIEDDPDLAFDDWISWGGPSADEVWARYYIEHTLHDLYHWAESHGVKWVDMKPQEGNSVMRWQRSQGNGRGLMTHLIAAFEERGGEIVTNAEITDIKLAGGRAAGIEGVNPESGEAIDVAAKAVVVTTGGFNSNIDMVREARPDLGNDRVMEGSGFGSTGDGHRMVRNIGGYLTHMDHIWFYAYATPDYRDPEQKRGLVCRQIPGYIWVNQQGERFHNEALSGGNSATPALMAQSPRHAWAIVDAPMKATLEVADPYYRLGDKIDRDKVEELLENSPFIKKSDSLEGLAQEIEVDVEAFMTAVTRYNAACAEGLDHEPDFGKPLDKSKPFDTPPYYAIQFCPLARKNFGGVKTDIRCRVLDRHFEPIPGLFAAGEVAGMAGGHINGRAGLEGTMLGPSVFSGRVAGGWAAHETGHGGGFVGTPNRG